MEYIYETIQVHAWHWDDVLWKRKTTPACLVFELSALELVPYSKPCVGHNSLTVWNIFMKHYRCMHDIETMCHEKGRQRLLVWFLNYLPLTLIHIVNRVWAITPKPYGIYLWKFTDACMTLRRCVMNMEDNSCLFGLWIICPWLNSI